MAGKSMLPLLAVAGVAAMALSKKKKKKAPASNGELIPEGEEEKEEAFPKWTEAAKGGNIGDLEFAPEGQSKLVFDEACQAFADKLNGDAHETYITGMFHAAVKDGVTSAADIVMGMLKDQASQCPWDDAASYTPLMTAVSDQLLAGVTEYARQRGIELT